MASRGRRPSFREIDDVFAAAEIDAALGEPALERCVQCSGGTSVLASTNDSSRLGQPRGSGKRTAKFRRRGCSLEVRAAVRRTCVDGGLVLGGGWTIPCRSESVARSRVSRTCCSSGPRVKKSSTDGGKDVCRGARRLPFPPPRSTLHTSPGVSCSRLCPSATLEKSSDFVGHGREAPGRGAWGFVEH